MAPLAGSKPMKSPVRPERVEGRTVWHLLLAAALLLPLALPPRPACALRGAGLEENAAKPKVLEALRAGLEGRESEVGRALSTRPTPAAGAEEGPEAIRALFGTVFSERTASTSPRTLPLSEQRFSRYSYPPFPFIVSILAFEEDGFVSVHIVKERPKAPRNSTGRLKYSFREEAEIARYEFRVGNSQVSQIRWPDWQPLVPTKEGDFKARISVMDMPWDPSAMFIEMHLKVPGSEGTRSDDPTPAAGLEEIPVTEVPDRLIPSLQTTVSQKILVLDVNGVTINHHSPIGEPMIQAVDRFVRTGGEVVFLTDLNARQLNEWVMTRLPATTTLRTTPLPWIGIEHLDISAPPGLLDVLDDQIRQQGGPTILRPLTTVIDSTEGQYHPEDVSPESVRHGYLIVRNDQGEVAFVCLAYRQSWLKTQGDHREQWLTGLRESWGRLGADATALDRLRTAGPDSFIWSPGKGPALEAWIRKHDIDPRSVFFLDDGMTNLQGFSTATQITRVSLDKYQTNADGVIQIARPGERKPSNGPALAEKIVDLLTTRLSASGLEEKIEVLTPKTGSSLTEIVPLLQKRLDDSQSAVMGIRYIKPIMLQTGSKSWINTTLLLAPRKSSVATDLARAANLSPSAPSTDFATFQPTVTQFRVYYVPLAALGDSVPMLYVFPVTDLAVQADLSTVAQLPMHHTEVFHSHEGVAVEGQVYIPTEAILRQWLASDQYATILTTLNVIDQAHAPLTPAERVSVGNLHGAIHVLAQEWVIRQQMTPAAGLEEDVHYYWDVNKAIEAHPALRDEVARRANHGQEMHGVLAVPGGLRWFGVFEAGAAHDTRTAQRLLEVGSQTLGYALRLETGRLNQAWSKTMVALADRKNADRLKMQRVRPAATIDVSQGLTFQALLRSVWRQMANGIPADHHVDAWFDTQTNTLFLFRYA